MINLFVEIINVIEGAFEKIQAKVPPPDFIDRGLGKVFRYQNETVEVAIVQKCARMVSGLNASLVLLRSGYVQELGALFRMLDEFNEDILFLCQAIQTGETTELHKKYLKAFYQEEFDNPSNALLSKQNRPTVQRKKIHAAISRIPGQELNQSDNKELHRTLSQAYSGYVHGASVHIMEMYGGNPPKFHISGMLGTPRIAEFTNNTWDYFYRGLITIMMVALTFKQKNMLRQLYEFRDYIEKKSHRTEWDHPEVLVKRAKRKKA